MRHLLLLLAILGACDVEDDRAKPRDLCIQEQCGVDAGVEQLDATPSGADAGAADGGLPFRVCEDHENPCICEADGCADPCWCDPTDPTTTWCTWPECPIPPDAGADVTCATVPMCPGELKCCGDSVCKTHCGDP